MYIFYKPKSYKMVTKLRSGVGRQACFYYTIFSLNYSVVSSEMYISHVTGGAGLFIMARL